jgi:hypothetical protein
VKGAGRSVSGRGRRARPDRVGEGHMPATWTVQEPVLWIMVIAGAIVALTLASMSSLRVWLTAARRSKVQSRVPPKD